MAHAKKTRGKSGVKTALRNEPQVKEVPSCVSVCANEVQILKKEIRSGNNHTLG